MESEQKSTHSTAIIGYILVIPLMWLLLILHRQFFCWLSQTDDSFGLACRGNWYNGLFFCIAYSVAKLIGLARDNDDILRLFARTMVLYIVIFGLYAWPYMLVSFVQHLEVHTLLHFIILYFVLENLGNLLDRRWSKFAD